MSPCGYPCFGENRFTSHESNDTDVPQPIIDRDVPQPIPTPLSEMWGISRVPDSVDSDAASDFCQAALTPLQPNAACP